ncbi:MAG TPA: hypothetical protein VK363_17410 [Pyrinomonadaceae bacterium]|nr:hypothetical protein [Pyrinomonadaceae bacterium]
MKRLRQLCAVTVLTILFSNFALAEGIMHPAYQPTPTPTPVGAGIMHPAFTDTSEPTIQSEEPEIDLEMEIKLYLIQNLLALF